MRIDELNLIRYGHFKDRALPFATPDSTGAPDLHLIIGDNEAGKSTVRKAIPEWLWGIYTQSTMWIGFQQSEMRIGGQISHAGNVLPFVRKKGRSPTLLDPTGVPLPDSVLSAYLGGISDKAYFESMFCLDHDSMRAGGEAMLAGDKKDRFARMLFESAAGIATLKPLLERLEAEADEIYGIRAKSSRRYDMALQQMTIAKSALRGCEIRVRVYRQKQEAVSTAKAKLAELQAARDAQRVEKALLTRVNLLGRRFDALKEAQAERVALGTLPALPSDALQRTQHAVNKIARLEGELRRLADEAVAADRAANDIKLDEGLEAAAADIAALNEQLAQVREAREDLVTVSAELKGLTDDLFSEVREIGWTDIDSVQAIEARLPTRPQLATANSLLGKRREHASKLTESQQQLGRLCIQREEVLAALAALPATIDIVPLKAAVDALRAALSQRPAQRVVTDAETRLARRLEQLGSFDGDATALRGMSLPSQDAGRHADARRVNLQNQLDQMKSRIDSVTEAYQDAERRLARVLESPGVVDSEALSVARETRNRTWGAIRRQEIAVDDVADEYEAAVDDADRLADQRYEHAERMHEADDARRQTAEAMQQLRTLRDRNATLTGELAAAAFEWSQLLANAGLRGLGLQFSGADLERWCVTRDAVLTLDDALVEARAAQAASDSQIAEASRRLRALLDPIVSDITGEADLVARAVEQLDASTRVERDRERHTIETVRVRSEATRLLAAADQLNKDGEALSEHWRQTAEAIGIDPAIDPAAAGEVLQILGMLEPAVRKWKDLKYRVEQMSATIHAFTNGVRKLEAVLGMPEAMPESTVRVLVSRIETEKTRRAEAASHRHNAARQRDAHAETDRQIEAERQGLTDLLLIAGVDDTAALLEVAQHCERARSLDAKNQTLRDEVVADGQGLPFDALDAEVSSTDRTTVLTRLAALAELEIAQDYALTAAGGELATAEDALDAVGDGDAAARAESDRVLAVTAMQDAIERFIEVKASATILRWAIAKYRAQTQGPMLSAASRIFSTLTLGRYDSLTVDDGDGEPELVAMLRDDPGYSGTVRKRGVLSDGTRDALYLSLRLAAIEIHLQEHPGAPVICDDLFVNLDDARAAAGMQVLAKLAEKTQVIYLSHHRHLESVARSAVGPINVVDLGGQSSLTG
ncbi:MAG: AAA family ATPase [Nevskia sp.]|nr:AAA family ATPase [Nevskia sp.]